MVRFVTRCRKKVSRLPQRTSCHGALLGLLLALSSAGYAQRVLPRDSVYTLPAVRVQVERPRRFATGSRVITLDSAALAPYRAGTLTDALAARTPLYLKNYGPGQLSTITMRGTSAQHTAVLWHGFNVMLPTLGQNDFALLPVSGNTRVDIQPGPASGLYGSGAIGGTILLSSPVRWAAGPSAAVQLDGGSFGLRAGSVEGNFSNHRVAVRTSATYRTAQNDFRYSLPDDSQQRQTNAALRQGSLAQDATWRVGKASALQAAAWLTDSYRQIQPAIGSQNDHARQYDRSRRLLLGYAHTTARHESAVRVAWFEDVLNYHTDQLRSDSRVRTTQVQASHTLRFGPTTSLRLGVEAQHFAAQLTSYGRDRTENRFAGFALLRYDPWPRLRLSGTLRQAVLPGRRPPLAPVVGAEWEALSAPTHRLLVKGSAARGYRAPTLNERYYQPGGDPTLRPEDSFGAEGGLRHEWQPAAWPAWALHTELTAYRQRVDNWVMWWTLPNESFIRPHNLRQVLTKGLEATSELTWHTATASLTARALYAYTRAYKTKDGVGGPTLSGRQLYYVPLHTAAATLDGTWRRWQGGAVFTFTGFRYVQDEGPAFLPSYGLLDARLGYVLPLPGHLRFTVLAQGHNLTNRNYQSYLYRAMPPRWVQLSLRVAWH